MHKCWPKSPEKNTHVQKAVDLLCRMSMYNMNNMSFVVHDLDCRVYCATAQNFSDLQYIGKP